MFSRLLKNKKGEGYIDVIIGVFVVIMVLVITLNIFTFVTMKTHMDRIADALIETATFSGGFGENFDKKVSELQEKYFKFDVDIGAEAWYNVDYRRVQLGDGMSITVRAHSTVSGVNVVIPMELSVHRTGQSEQYWRLDDPEYDNPDYEADDVMRFALNNSNMTFHDMMCTTLTGVPKGSLSYTSMTHSECVAIGYTACTTCSPHVCTAANGVEYFNKQYHWGTCACGEVAGTEEHYWVYKESENTYYCSGCLAAWNEDHKYCEQCEADLYSATHPNNCITPAGGGSYIFHHNFEATAGLYAISGKGTLTLSDKKAYTGNYSYVMDEAVDVIQIPIGSVQSGNVISIMFYDSGDEGASVGAALNGTDYLGINANVSQTHYAYLNSSNNETNWVVATNVPRSEGWHKLTWDFSNGETCIAYIDNIRVAKFEGITSYSKINIGDWWDQPQQKSNISNMYFDDLIITSPKKETFKEIKLENIIVDADDWALVTEENPTYVFQNGGMKLTSVESPGYAVVTYASNTYKNTVFSFKSKTDIAQADGWTGFSLTDSASVKRPWLAKNGVTVVMKADQIELQIRTENKNYWNADPARYTKVGAYLKPGTEQNISFGIYELNEADVKITLTIDGKEIFNIVVTDSKLLSSEYYFGALAAPGGNTLTLGNIKG